MCATAAVVLALVVLHASGPHDGWALDIGHPTWWQPLTSIFVHSTALHLASNSLVIAVAGGVGEYMHGSARILLVFVYSGVGASLAYGFFRATTWSALGLRGTVVGASGGAFGLLAAHGAHLALNWHEQRFGVVWLLVLLVGGAAEIATFVIQPMQRVAYTAHVFGCVHGALVGMVVLRNIVVRPWEKRMRPVFALVSAALLMGSALGFYLR